MGCRFWKNEVAMRCAFKAITNGKQVILVSHNDFIDAALSDFIQALCVYGRQYCLSKSFVSTKEIKEIKQKLAAGMIDIVIGTHKLLNKTFNIKI